MDLEFWTYALKERFDVWVEIHDSKTVLLRATSLDESESATEARDRAIAYIDRLNGTMALSYGARPVRFGGTIIKFTPDGRLDETIFIEAAQLEFRGSIVAVADTVIRPDGKPVPPPAPALSEVQRWSEIADQETWLNDALIYFGRATNWFDIYKALECLMDKYGGEREFVKLNWASKSDVERLKQTANSFRHANRKENQPPPNPPDFKEGRELLGQLLRRALEEAAK